MPGAGTPNADKHFHMSKDYEKHSSSQKTIGQTTIESAVKYSKSEFKDQDELKVLDIACGPGNLTIELKKSLQQAFPETKINLAGLDYSSSNVELLVEKSKGEISGIAGSFYELPIAPESLDIVTSNEGLHWQPPYEMSEIIYSQLPSEEREKYEKWALENFRKSIKNIFISLKKDGVAVLQFGHEGQLQKLWDLIRDVLNEEKFQTYKSKVSFPLYYPSLEDIKDALLEAGFSEKNIEVNSFNQDLTEDKPESISGFLQAFSRPGFSKFFKSEDLDAFYARIEEKLGQSDIDEFRKNQWCRTLVNLKK